MGEKTGISWCDHTFNPWQGCTRVSPGCQKCYAETLSNRWGLDIWGPTKDRRFFGEDHWKEPLKWNRKAQKEGRQHWVFCASMADVYEEHINPHTNTKMQGERLKLWELIGQTSWLNWQILTKRPENILGMTPLWVLQLPTILFGTSVEDQRRAEERIPQLLELRKYNPEVVLFLSIEPQLAYVNPSPWLPQLNWIIQGGESGDKHRPFDPEWAYKMRDFCLLAEVAYFFKQHGGRTSHSGGCLLDGREWKEFPKMPKKGILVQ